VSAAPAAPVLTASGLLVVSGTAKLRAPGPAAQALRAAGVPARQWLVQLLSLGELALGVLGFVAPGRLTAGLLVAAYGTSASSAYGSRAGAKARHSATPAASSTSRRTPKPLAPLSR
jgi:uncharacterized membrane protein YphA (DoxX/SURF4 family)